MGPEEAVWVPWPGSPSGREELPPRVRHPHPVTSSSHPGGPRLANWTTLMEARLPGSGEAPQKSETEIQCRGLGILYHLDVFNMKKKKVLMFLLRVDFTRELVNNGTSLITL